MAQDNWDKLKDDAIEVLRGYFKDESPDAEDMKRVKVASSALSSFTRHEQTESSREQNAIVAGRALFSNEQEYAEFIRLSVPRLGFSVNKVREIPEKVGAGN